MIQRVRGFNDVFPPLSDRISRLESAARRILARYGYQEIRLPTIEPTELFWKSTGESSDIVEKEMFVLQARKDDETGGEAKASFAMRPEGTPGVVRAYIESGLNKTKPRQRYFYIGSMFRHDRPQKGRFREFTQIGIECFGIGAPQVDAEVILALRDIFLEAGIRPDNLKLLLNTIGHIEGPDSPLHCRLKYRADLAHYLISIKETLCSDCQRRITANPLRALDCKRDGERLRQHAPRLHPCEDCRAHFEEVKSLLAASSIAFEYDPFLVRGLDYYSRTVFEFKIAGIGSQDTIGAGGRYDGLILQMGGNPTPAVGWAMGVERTLLALENEAEAPPRPVIYIATQSKSPRLIAEAFELAHRLRHSQGFENVSISGVVGDRQLKDQLKEASHLNARFSIIIGEDEIKAKTYVVKDMRSQTQEHLPKDEFPSLLKHKVEGMIQ